MVSIFRRLTVGMLAGLALATVFFMAGTSTLAAVPSLGTIFPVAAASVGFICGIGSALSLDLKLEAQKEEKQASKP